MTIVPRYSFFQRLCCVGVKKDKKKDNCIHYEEVISYYPKEFKEVFHIKDEITNNNLNE